MRLLLILNMFTAKWERESYPEFHNPFKGVPGWKTSLSFSGDGKCEYTKGAEKMTCEATGNNDK
jgi:hypothetical protein